MFNMNFQNFDFYSYDPQPIKYYYIIPEQYRNYTYGFPSTPKGVIFPRIERVNRVFTGLYS